MSRGWRKELVHFEIKSCRTRLRRGGRSVGHKGSLRRLFVGPVNMLFLGGARSRFLKILIIERERERERDKVF